MNKHIPKYTAFYYLYNKKIHKLNTIIDIPNDIIVFFTIGSKEIITNLQSLFRTINMIENPKSELFNNNNLLDSLFRGLKIASKKDITYDDMDKFRCLINKNKKITLIFLYQYRFSNLSLHGLNDIYIENFIECNILNLKLLKNKFLYISIDSIISYKLSNIT